MQQPSLYSHFASKQAIYDAMFKQAGQIYLDDARSAADALPAEPRPRLIAMAEHYFDFAVADLPRHQLMDVNVVPNFQPSADPWPAVFSSKHFDAMPFVCRCASSSALMIRFNPRASVLVV